MVDNILLNLIHITNYYLHQKSNLYPALLKTRKHFKFFNKRELEKVCVVIDEICKLIPMSFEIDTTKTVKEIKKEINDIYPTVDFSELRFKKFIGFIMKGLYLKFKDQSNEAPNKIYNKIIENIESKLDTSENSETQEPESNPESIPKPPEPPALKYNSDMFKDLRKTDGHELDLEEEITNLIGMNVDDDVGVIGFTDGVKNPEEFARILMELNQDFNRNSEEIEVKFEDMPFRNKNELDPDVYEEQQELYDQFKTKNNKPVVERENYRINSMENLKESIFNSLFKANLPTKVNIGYNLIIEGSNKEGDVYYQPRKEQPFAKLNHNKDKIIRNVDDMKEFYNLVVDQINEYVQGYIDKAATSSERYVALYGIQIVKYNLPTTGGLIPELEKYKPLFRKIYIEPEDDKLCLFKALVHHNFKDLKRDQIKAKAKKYYKEFYGVEYNEKYEGFIWEREIEYFCKTFKVDIHKYTYDIENKTLTIKSIHDYGFASLPGKVMDLISETYNDNEHVMYCRDISLLGDSLYCPKCGKGYKYKTGKSYKLKFSKHVSACDGNIKQKLINESYDIPYCPVFTKNKLYTYCLIHNLPYTPMEYYMTYDFETIDTLQATNKDTLKAGSFTTAYLDPFSISLSIKTRNGISSRYFCKYLLDGDKLIENKRFVTDFIQEAIECGERLAKINEENFIKNLGKKYAMIKDDEYFSKYLCKYCAHVSIFAWNGEKFDSNFIKHNLNGVSIAKVKIMGSGCSSKQIAIKTNSKIQIGETKKPIKILFRDAKNYVSSCTLDAATQSYGKCESRVKGVFPYAKLNSKTIKTELLRTEPFEQKDFFNELTQCDLPDDEYMMYLETYKQFKNFYQYTKYYNVQDTEIMFKVIDNLTKLYWEHKLDVIQNLSLSSLASQSKYLMCYKDFDWNKEYAIEKDTSERFKVTESWWKYKCNSYYKQDQQAERIFSCQDNVNEEDYEYFKKLIEDDKTGFCWSCKCKFTYKLQPTLDRISNSCSHTKDNVRLACLYCNRFCGNMDSKLRSFFIQLKRYAILNNLTFTIKDESDKKHLISSINGGLSTVHHRMNIHNKNTITKLEYDILSDTVKIIDTGNKITHFTSVDFNSLYPSCYSSEFNINNPYTNHKMYMPGRLTSSMTVVEPAQLRRAMYIIKSKTELFSALIKGHIPEENRNKCINFLPIIRNINVEKDSEIIGEYMYEYMSKHNYNTTNSERKLTQTFCTYPISEFEFKKQYHYQLMECQNPGKYKWIHGFKVKGMEETDIPNKIPINVKKETGYMYFTSYYLWFLIDTFGFVVEDVQWIATFTKHDKFNNFVNDCMTRRQEAKINKDKVGDLHFKNMMNSSYGYDSMRTDKYNKIEIVSKRKAFDANRNPYHLDTVDLGNNKYLIVKQCQSYKIDTPIHCAAFTLDNAKFWYLNFIYNFLNKCLDMNCVHFVEGDTDSQYWAVSGDVSDNSKQGFKYVIKDHEFYNKHVFEWLPYDYYCSDESYRPKLETEVDKMAHEKKLLGCAIEKQGLNIVALGPKCYTTWGEITDYKGDDNGLTLSEAESYRWLRDFDNGLNSGNKTISLKVKGVNMKVKTNKQKINKDTYLSVIENMDLFYGTNYLLQYKKISTNTYKYCRITMNKIALSGVHIKMKVHNDNCQTCTPLYMFDYNPESLPDIYVDCELDNEALDFDYKYVFDKNNYYDVKEWIGDDRLTHFNEQYYVPKCLQYPLRHHEKCSRYGATEMDCVKKTITGCALNLKYGSVIVVDFDFDKSLDSNQKENLRNKIIEKYQLKTGLVLTTSQGLHAYFKADKVPFWYTQNNKYRHIACFGSEIDGLKFDIDLLISDINSGQNFVVYPGSKCRSKDKQLRQYQKLSDWSYDDLENYSDFDKRFNEIENRYLVEKEFKPVVEVETTRTIKDVDDSKLDEVLNKFNGVTIHGHKNLTAFRLLMAFSAFNDETYKYCIDYVLKNCDCTPNAKSVFDEYYDQAETIRSKYQCYNGLKRLEKIISTY